MWQSGWDGKAREIVVQFWDRAPRHYRGTLAQWYICQLLHEMLHAFFGIYRCRCNRCAMRDVDYSRNGGEGCDGHGPAWVEAVIALERAFQQAVNWEVDLNVVRSAQMNIEVEEGWVPDREMLES
jgi:hypothetical protein